MAKLRTLGMVDLDDVSSFVKRWELRWCICIMPRREVMAGDALSLLEE